MKKSFLRAGLLAALLALFPPLASNAGLNTFSLVETPWKLKPVGAFSSDYREPVFDDTDWAKQRLPAHWQELPHLSHYFGRMVYRKSFKFTAEEGKSYRLRFNGVFYKSFVYLNGEYLGYNEGYFMPFEFDVTDRLLDENVLVVEVQCLKEKNIAAKEQVMGVFGQWDAIAERYCPGGIWRPVEIIESGPAWIDKIKLTTLEIREGEADIKVEAFLRNPQGHALTLAIKLDPDNFNGEGLDFSATSKSQSLEQKFIAQNPALWTTHDRGFPNCYKAAALLYDGDRLMDRTSFLFGIRTIEMKQYHHVFLNGESLFIKGNNYAPSDVYLARATMDVLEKDVQMFKDAHYNMVRVHPHVDRPEFYDLCDRNGVLLWQDFPLQWGYEPAMEKEIIRQYEVFVDYLYNHPSIGVWCPHNEPLAVGVYLVKPKLSDVLRSAPGVYNTLRGDDWNFAVLDPKLKAAGERLDPYRTTLLNSGFGEGQDSHSYWGWYQGEADDFAKQLEEDPLKYHFTTEFGAQAFPPCQDTIKITGKELKDVQWSNVRVNHMFQTLLQWKRTGNYRDYESLCELVEATQVYQARIQQYHIERLRALKYDPNNGIVTFLHNDSHPAVTWSAVDYERNPKLAYYTIQRAFQPVLGFGLWQFKPYRQGQQVMVPIYAVNDTLNNYPAAELAVTLTKDDKQVLHRIYTIALPPDSKAVKAGEIVFVAEEKGTYKLSLVVKADNMISNNLIDLYVDYTPWK